MKIKLRLPSHMTLRLVALLFAICLWFISGENNQIPWLEAEERIVSVPVSVDNTAPDLVVTGMPSPVEVRLRVPKGTDLSNLTAHADVTGKKAGEHRVAVNVPQPARGAVLSVQPSYVQLRLERSVSAKFNIEVALLGVKAGNKPNVAKPQPEMVTFTGAESRMNLVARAVVTVVYRPTGGEVIAEVRAVDASGYDVPWIKASPSKATVRFIPENAGSADEPARTKQDVVSPGPGVVSGQ